MTKHVQFETTRLRRGSRRRPYASNPLILVVSLALATMMLSGCGGNRAVPTTALESATPTSYPSEVDWETAIEILNTGEVASVAQLHSLAVTLVLKDGTEIHTVEPSIDAIFHEVEKCGELCSEILLATE